MGRRKSAIPRFSLFSFQDIITCTTGIMLMITLVMALRLVESSASAPPAQTKKLVEQLESELESIADQVGMLEDQFQQQKDILDSGALVDVSTLQNQQTDLEDRQQQVNSDLTDLMAQQQLVDSRQQRMEAKATSRSGEVTEIAEL